MIIIDSSEPQFIKDRLNKKVEIEIKDLEVGDYLLPNNIAIERKTTTDLIASTFYGELKESKRLWTQIKNLKQYEHPLVVIITDNKWKYFYFSKSRNIHSIFFSIINAIIFSWNIPVVLLENNDEFIMYLLSLYSYAKSEKKGERPTPMAKLSRNTNEILEDILCMIPNVGLKTSKKLLTKFRNIKTIANKSVEELLEAGIRKPAAVSVNEFLNKNYE